MAQISPLYLGKKENADKIAEMNDLKWVEDCVFNSGWHFQGMGAM